MSSIIFWKLVQLYDSCARQPNRRVLHSKQLIAINVPYIQMASAGGFNDLAQFLKDSGAH